MKTERQHQKELLGAIINTYNLSKEEVIDLVEDVFANNVMSNGTIEVGYYAFTVKVWWRGLILTLMHRLASEG